MKKYYFGIMVLLFVSGCSVTQTSYEPSKKSLEGTWEVTNVRFIGDSGLYKVNLFDLVDSECFKGSEWVLIPDNGSGKLTILNSDLCENTINKIQWSLHEPGDGTFQFQFKYVGTTNNEVGNLNRGYRSKISDLNASSMKMNVIADVMGKPFELEMTFDKTSEEINL